MLNGQGSHDAFQLRQPMRRRPANKGRRYPADPQRARGRWADRRSCSCLAPLLVQSDYFRCPRLQGRRVLHSREGRIAASHGRRHRSESPDAAIDDLVVAK